MYSKELREEFGLKHSIFMTQDFALRCNIHCTKTLLKILPFIGTDHSSSSVRWGFFPLVIVAVS